MGEPGVGIVKSVKDGVVTAIKGTGDVAKAVVDTVASTLRTVIKDTDRWVSRARKPHPHCHRRHPWNDRSRKRPGRCGQGHDHRSSARDEGNRRSSRGHHQPHVARGHQEHGRRWRRPGHGCEGSGRGLHPRRQGSGHECGGGCFRCRQWRARGRRQHWLDRRGEGAECIDRHHLWREGRTEGAIQEHAIVARTLTAAAAIRARSRSGTGHRTTSVRARIYWAPVYCAAVQTALGRRCHTDS